MWWQREILDVFCKCNPHSHETARRSLWCTRFNSWMHPFVASRSNRSDVNPFLPTATRRDCSFSWRCHAIHLRPAKSAARRSCATLVPSPVLDRGESASRWYPQRTYSGDYIKSGYTEKINRAKRAAMFRVNGLAIATNEKINGHGRSDQDDKGFHPGLRQFLRKVRAGVPAQQGAHGHDDGLRPDDRAGHDESHRGDTVNDPAENHLELVHDVNVGHADCGEHRQIHDADAAAEIAATNGDEQLEDRSPGDGRRGGVVRDACRNPPGQMLAEGKQQRGGEHEPRQHMQEGLRGRLDQE